MTRSDPAAALSGVQTGRYCDSCNQGVRTGDLVRGYATCYERDGWVLRRLWCDDCGHTTIDRGTAGADEVTIEAVFWNHRLISVTITDRNHPDEK